MADDAAPPGGEGDSSGPKEIEGFQVTRAAPQEEKPPVMAFAVVILVLLVGGGIAWKLSQGDGSSDGATAGAAGGATGAATGKPVETFPPDVEVPDEVWDRIDFLESEGQLEKCLDFCKEQHEFYPNKELRDKMAELSKELGVGVPDETYPEALRRARDLFSKDERDWEEIISAATDAIDLAEEDANLGEAYFMRGVGKGNTDDTSGAITDLETAIDYDFRVSDCKKMIAKFEGE